MSTLRAPVIAYEAEPHPNADRLEHPSGRGPGRVIFKSVSARHLLRKGGTEYQ